MFGPAIPDAELSSPSPTEVQAILAACMTSDPQKEDTMNEEDRERYSVLRSLTVRTMNGDNEGEGEGEDNQNNGEDGVLGTTGSAAALNAGGATASPVVGFEAAGGLSPNIHGRQLLNQNRSNVSNQQQQQQDHPQCNQTQCMQPGNVIVLLIMGLVGLLHVTPS